MELALRIVFAVAFALVAARSARRELGSIEPFDLLLLLVIGDLGRFVIAASGYSPSGALLAGLVFGCTTLALCRSTSPKPTSSRS